jgi:pimeloyl-ACP methyl ester carboxylesterase
MKKIFLLSSIFIFLFNLANAEEVNSQLNIITKRVKATTANLKASIYTKTYVPADNQKHRAIVMCPGSWEYSAAWEFYYPPFTPEFIAKQGFIVVTWDPRGSFMANPGPSTEPLNPKAYGIGKSFPPYPPEILMLNETIIDDLYDVITYANSLDRVRKNKITVMGFSHGATYPVTEKVIKKDKRVSSLVLIEPIGDESSLVDMLVGNVPVVGDALVNISKAIPENVYESLLWRPLYIIPPHITGLATKYAKDIKIPVIIIQSEQFHASLTAPIFGGKSTSQGVTLYASLTNTPYKQLNRNAANADINNLVDFFPAPIWEDGELFCDYFINDIIPVITQ